MRKLRRLDLKDQIIERFKKESEENFINVEETAELDQEGRPVLVRMNVAVKDMCSCLTQLGLFSEYTRGQLTLLVKVMQIRKVPQGEWVFHEVLRPAPSSVPPV